MVKVGNRNSVVYAWGEFPVGKYVKSDLEYV